MGVDKTILWTVIASIHMAGTIKLGYETLITKMDEIIECIHTMISEHKDISDICVTPKQIKF